MIKKITRNEARIARHKRSRDKISGTANVPRLCVFKSNKNISVQVIDDESMNTLVSASSIDKDLNIKGGNSVEVAKLVGESIAKKALKLKIKKVVFDRGGYLYHGRIKALAEAARANGLEF